MDYSQVIESYNQQIKALGERYTFSNDMCDYMRVKLQSVSGFSSKTFFDVASSFCKFYQDSIETTKQISLISQERDDIIEMMKRNGNK